MVADQFGRLTFAQDIAAGIVHLLGAGAAFGTYNLSNTGDVQTWADIAGTVFELTGHDRSRVTGVSTETYFAGKSAAPRPLNSTFDLAKILDTGFVPRDTDVALRDYLERP